MGHLPPFPAKNGEKMGKFLRVVYEPSDSESINVIAPLNRLTQYYITNVPHFKGWNQYILFKSGISASFCFFVQLYFRLGVLRSSLSFSTDAVLPMLEADCVIQASNRDFCKFWLFSRLGAQKTVMGVILTSFFRLLLPVYWEFCICWCKVCSMVIIFAWLL